MVFDQAGIRLLRRPEHPDALERNTATGGVEHRPHRVAHLVVGVGRRHDGDVAVDPRLLAVVADRQELWIVFDEVDVDGSARVSTNLRAIPLRSTGMHDDVAPVRHLAGADEPCRLGEQVGLVVPRGLQAGGDGPADPHGLLGAPRRRGETHRRVGPGEADLLVDAAQGDDRGGVTGDLAERAGLLLERLRDGQLDERRRHRRAP